MGDLMRLLKYSNRGAWFKNLPHIPVLLVAGEEDPVGNYGKGVLWVEEGLKKQGHNVKCVLYKGEDAIYEYMEGLKFKIGPKSFYQTNTKQAYKLYSVAREYAALTGSEVVYDLYTGTGTIAQFVSRQASKVIGIEYVPEAIEDAKLNAQNNNITNCDFYAGDMKDILTDEFVAEHGHPDVIILDPPRAGIHPDVAQVILNAAPDRMVYVSCNPASQARDLEILCKDYVITAVRPVDMFPHTHHVENVVALKRK